MKLGILLINQKYKANSDDLTINHIWAKNNIVEK